MEPKSPRFSTAIGSKLYYYYCCCFLKAHQHKAAGGKTGLDIQNYGCNGNLLCYHGVVERNRISSLQSDGKALEKECCLRGIFCELLCELNGHLMPCTSCFYGKWVKDVCAGQFGVFVLFCVVFWAAPLGLVAVLPMWDSAYVSGTFTSQAIGFPLAHGKRVVPSGRLLSSRIRLIIIITTTPV